MELAETDAPAEDIDVARAAVQRRYVPGFPGFTQQMLDEAEKADEEF